MAEKPFNKPLDKWIDEQEPVEQIIYDFNPQTGKITSRTETTQHTFKVKYERSRVESVFCKDFTHVWHVIDSHHYLIKCHHCPLTKRIMPGLEYIDPHGHVRLRDTDEQIAWEKMTK